MLDTESPVWIRSRRCESGNCVEISWMADGRVAMRDSKDPEGPVLRLSRDNFRAFVSGIGNLTASEVRRF